jgi:exosortase E/protease (VPEID-CTERM system)
MKMIHCLIFAIVALLDALALDLAGVRQHLALDVLLLSRSLVFGLLIVVCGGIALSGLTTTSRLFGDSSWSPTKRVLWTLHPLVVLSLAAGSRALPGNSLSSLLGWLAGGLLPVAVLVFLVMPFGSMGTRRRLLSGLAVTASVLAVLMSAMALANTHLVWGIARYGTLPLVQGILAASGVSARCQLERAALFHGDFGIRIGPACSGIEGVIFFWLCFFIYLLASRDRIRVGAAIFWCLPLGTLAMWTLNAVRIAGLFILGASGHAQLASGAFHSHAGWILSDLVILGLVVLTELLFRNAGSRSDPTATPAGKVGSYLTPQLVVLACGIVAAACGQPDALYPLIICCGAWAVYVCGSIQSDAWEAPDAVAFLLGVLAFVVWMVLEPTGATSARAGQLVGFMRSGVWISFRIVGSVLIIPVVEELAFRGFLMRRLYRNAFSTVAYRECGAASVAGAALVFGLLHSRPVAAVLAGILFGLAARRRGILSDAVVAHAVANALVAATVLLTGRMELW